MYLAYHKKEKWSNRKIFIRIGIPIIATLIIIIMGIGVAAILSYPSPTIVEVGQTIELSDEKDQNSKGLLFGYTANFSWSMGTIQAKVNSVNKYNSIAEAGLSTSDFTNSTEVSASDKFVLIDLTFENIGEDIDTFDFSVGSLYPEKFCTGFNVIRKDTYIPTCPVYYNNHSPKTDGSKDYWIGDFPPKSEKTFQIGFLVRPDQTGSYVLVFGTNGRTIKYGVRIGNIV